MLAAFALAWILPFAPFLATVLAQGGQRAHTPTFDGPPAGMQKLPLDLFLSKNFYKDSALWSDQRYFRCNTPRQLTDMWASHRIGDEPPASAKWGDCGTDYPREKIVSPYPYKTAKEHYEALLAAAEAKGGPTQYTKTTVPDWDGYYRNDESVDQAAEWMWGTVNQTSTILSLLTPDIRRAWCKATITRRWTMRRSGKLPSAIRKDSCAGGSLPHADPNFN